MEARFGKTIQIRVRVKNSSNTPSSPDEIPVCKIYSPSSETAILTPTVDQVGSETGLYEAEVAITAQNGFSQGDLYSVIWDWAISTVAGADEDYLLVS